MLSHMPTKIAHCALSSSTVHRVQPVVFDQIRKISYKLVVVGGGAGGCSTAAKFASKLGKGAVSVIEPSDVHYYQPMWTLVGGGMKTLKDSSRPMSQVLPKNADWIKSEVAQFMPDSNKILTKDGQEISYEYLVVAIGIQLNYNKIKGLPQAFETPGVCSNYSALHVNKTFESLKKFQKGNAIFTFPNTPIKCAGAPQKILYIAEEYLRKNNKRSDANMIFNTAQAALFGVKKYADALWEVVTERGINVNLQHNLVEVKPDSKEAVFEILSTPGTYESFPYEMLHVTPPMSSPDVLKQCTELVDQAGFLSVSKENLQHTKYKNIFGIGDCTSLPTSKTAAAVAAQLGILRTNLQKVMDGKEPVKSYDGYTSCPLVTGYNTCILAEFDYNGQPLETFPFNQAKERRISFHMKKDIMPVLYWKAMLNGMWEGPRLIRKVLHLGTSR